MELEKAGPGLVMRAEEEAGVRECLCPPSGLNAALAFHSPVLLPPGSLCCVWSSAAHRLTMHSKMFLPFPSKPVLLNKCPFPFFTTKGVRTTGWNYGQGNGPSG